MSGVLVDTSVWRRYFAGRAGGRNERIMAALLDSHEPIFVHRAVLGELVLGGLSSREEALLGALPAAMEAEPAEVLQLIRQRRLARRGVGWVDCHLLASALLSEAMLWSFDRPLSSAAAGLEIAFRAP